jgi:ABC-type branched-subunit amino acid transport system substrate-binding protein
VSSSTSCAPVSPIAEEDGVMVFDPTKVTDGIRCSEDEILATRPHAYAVSVERRS